MATSGYEYQPRKYVLKFEDYPGLEVVCRGVSVGELIRVLEMAEVMTQAPQLEQIQDMFGLFVSHLIGWNLRQGRKAVPKTVDALMTLDLDFSLAVVMAWVEAVTPGKSRTSSGTTPPQQMEASIPMSPPAAAAGT